MVHQGLPDVKGRPATQALQVLAVGMLHEAPFRATEAQAACAGALLKQGQCLLGAGIGVLKKEPQVLVRAPACSMSTAHRHVPERAGNACQLDSLQKDGTLTALIWWRRSPRLSPTHLQAAQLWPTGLSLG